MKSVKVIKVGGQVIGDDQKLDRFLKSFAAIEEPKVLIHGGGSIASDVGERLGIKPNLIDGRRITDKKTLELVTMVYGGLVSKKIVAKLQALGTNAVGLSGADLNIMPAKKRSPKPVDFGWVGEIENMNTTWLTHFLHLNTIPVLSPLTHDGNGNMLNTNADTIASCLASALSAELTTELIFCFEQAGVMKNGKPITEIDHGLYQHLRKSGIVTNGMIPKIDLSFKALNRGVQKVSIRNFEDVAVFNSGTQLLV